MFVIALLLFLLTLCVQNLESWRERRRAAAKALVLELQQHYDDLPQRETASKARILQPDNDMRDYMRELRLSFL